MSLNKFTSGNALGGNWNWMNVDANTVSVTNGIDMNNSGLTNVSSINGVPLGPFSVDINAFNIIYQPGGAIPPFSNVVNTWSQVLSKASQANINQIINIYFDDSKVSPAPIDATYDFKGRAVFKAHNSSTVQTAIQINDGVIISNIAKIEGPGINIICQSITLPCLLFDNNSKLIVSNNSMISISADSVIPGILINGQTISISMRHGCRFDNSLNLANSVVNVTNLGFLNLSIEESSNNSSDTVKGDLSSTLNLIYDAFVSTVPTQTNFLGVLSISAGELAGSMNYNDSKVSPAYGSSNIQGALDSVKTNYLLKNSTNSLTVGAITSSGNFSNGTNSMTTGNIFSGGISANGTITSNNTISNGTNAMTTGALSSGAITSSGTLATLGAVGIGGASPPVSGTLTVENVLSANTGQIITVFQSGFVDKFRFYDAKTASSEGSQFLLRDSSFPVSIRSDRDIQFWPNSAGSSSFTVTSNSISAGTNSVTCGAIISSGTISTGTNSLTCGSIVSSGTFTNGTNTMTSGAHSCTSLTSTGTMSCGTNGMTCGALSCTSVLSSGTVSSGTNSLTSGSIVSSGTFTNGTNAMTSGAHSCTSLTSTGTMSCGTNGMTCGALSCTSVLSSGTVSSGTNGMTCGALSCGSVTSTGDVTQPRYWLRLRRNASQSISNFTGTLASWDTIETLGGGNNNFVFSPPATNVTIPIAGLYLVIYTATWQSNGLGIRNHYLSFNADARRYAETDVLAATAGSSSIVGSIIYKFSVGDTINLTIFQSSGGNLNFSGTENASASQSTLEVVRLSE